GVPSNVPRSRQPAGARHEQDETPARNRGVLVYSRSGRLDRRPLIEGGRSEMRVSIAQLLLPEFDEEMAVTGRVLERVPWSRYAWQPHPNSMSLGRLATHVAELPKWALDAFALDEVDIAPLGGALTRRLVFDSVTNLVQWFADHAQAARQALAAASD